VTVNDATGAARFVGRLPEEHSACQAGRAQRLRPRERRSAEFLTTYRSIFGITNVSSELEVVRVAKDPQGGTHIVQRQLYQGVPVFAGELRSHFDASDELVAVNGTFVPEIA
jgi:Zn-dependent metalloprotease